MGLFLYAWQISKSVSYYRDPDPEPEEVKEELPDTIEAHLELVKERESKQKMKEEVWEQVRHTLLVQQNSYNHCIGC